MRVIKRILIASSSAGAVIATLFSFPSAAVAEYPDKPVSFVVQWAPSELEDALTRMIAKDFSDKYDSPAAVVTKSGVGPRVMDIAENPADGYTVGSLVNDMPANDAAVGTLSLVPNTIEPLGIFLTYPFVLVSSNDAPFSNITAMTQAGMEKPLALAHTGKSLVPTKTAIAFARNAGFEWGSEVLLKKVDCESIAANKADVYSTTLERVMPCLDSVTVLASLTDTRNPILPNTPTLGEIDSTLVLGFWNGLFVHKDTPAEIRDKIITVAKTTVNSERAQALAINTGAIVYWQDAEQAARRIVVDTGTLKEINKIVQ